MSNESGKMTAKEKIILFLENNKGQKFVVKSIAEAVGVSPKAVRRVIRWLKQKVPESVKVDKEEREVTVIYLGLPKNQSESQEKPEIQKQSLENTQEEPAEKKESDNLDLEEKYLEESKKEENDETTKLLDILEEGYEKDEF